ncbi:MAG: GldG family protein, partial [Pseudomonadota bacterium]
MSQQSKRNLTGGTLVVLAVLFIALVIINDVLFRGARVDLTENRLYSVSAGTERILDGLVEPVNLYFYFSDTASRDIPVLRTYATRVREMLEEFAERSGGNVRLEVIDPPAFSEAEDEAAAYGLQAIPAGPGGDNIFFGLVGTNTLDDVETVPFFQLDKETFLEYDIAKLIHNLGQPERPTVGVISSLPIGRGFDPATRQMREPWVVMQQLGQLFEVRQLLSTESAIDPEVDILLVVHPKNLGDATLYAIDQFVMRGGNLIAVVDPHAEIDQPEGMDPQQAMFAARSSDLPRLFDAWGIAYDPEQVVLDAVNGAQVGGQGGRPVRHIGVLSLTQDAMN